MNTATIIFIVINILINGVAVYGSIAAKGSKERFKSSMYKVGFIIQVALVLFGIILLII